MINKISVLFINELLTRTNLVKLVSKYLNLNKHGSYYRTHCPFHTENNPSFTINGKKQFYYCFGCGAYGNAIDFLMNFCHLNFTESIDELADLHGLQVKFCSNKNFNLYQDLYKTMENISSFYHGLLIHPKFYRARKYLLSRGLNSSTIKYFSIGFAPRGWDIMLSASKHKKISYQSLIRVGLLKNISYTNHSIFYERIIFPIRDKFGKTIGFGGRSLENKLPKYLNSPESPIFNKSHQLYGLYEVRKNNHRLQKLLIVEGYMDVLILFQFGINYAVSPLGTSTTEEHIRIIFSNTSNVIYCYDGDIAGRKAAWRVLNLSLKYITDNRQVQFIFLPNGEDPDSIIRKKGKLAFENFIDTALSFSTFLFDVLLSRVDLTKSYSRVLLSNLALPLINKIPGKVTRICLRKKLGKKIGILEDFNLEKLIPIKKNTNLVNGNKILKRTDIKILISLLIKYPRLSAQVPSLSSLEDKNHHGIDFLKSLVSLCNENPNISIGQILEYYRNTLYIQYLKILLPFNIENKEIAFKIFLEALDHLIKVEIEVRLNKLISLARTRNLTISERKEVQKLNYALVVKQHQTTDFC